jgi:hypothetical protein
VVKPFINSLKDMKTTLAKFAVMDACQLPLNKIKKGTGQISIVQFVMVIVLSAYAGSLAGSAQFTDSVDAKLVGVTEPGQ